MLPATRQRRHSRLYPAKAGTRFSDRGGMQGWVDLVWRSLTYLLRDSTASKSTRLKATIHSRLVLESRSQRRQARQRLTSIRRIYVDARTPLTTISLSRPLATLEVLFLHVRASEVGVKEGEERRGEGVRVARVNDTMQNGAALLNLEYNTQSLSRYL